MLEMSGGNEAVARIRFSWDRISEIGYLIGAFDGESEANTLSWKRAVQGKYVFPHEDFGLGVVVFQSEVDLLHEEFVQMILVFHKGAYSVVER